MSHNFSYASPEVLGVRLESEKCRDLGMAQPAESYGKGKAPVSLKERKKKREEEEEEWLLSMQTEAVWLRVSEV